MQPERSNHHPLARLGHRVAVSLATVVLGGAAVVGPAGAAASSTLTTRQLALGTVLTTGVGGRTLYMFGRDGRDHSACSGSCAETWKPLVAPAGLITAGPGVKRSLIGTISRGATRQLTYDHHPLYEFAGDTAAGTSKGENKLSFGGRWFAVSPTGAATKPGSAPPSFY